MRLLVVEDDVDLNRQIVRGLEEAGYAVDRAYDGEEGAFLGETEPYDAVVLDLGLPKKDGISIIGEWRKAGRTMPILILTARDRWSDKVKGFDAGADDYVAKPFHMEEVLARIRALLRRAAGHASSELVCGTVQLDTRASRVSVDGNPVKLTSHEYRLLSYLMHHAGRVVSRSEIVDHLYDQDFDRDFEHYRGFVGRLRRKLGVDIIQTMRGLGYLVNAEVAGADARPASRRPPCRPPGSPSRGARDHDGAIRRRRSHRDKRLFISADGSQRHHPADRRPRPDSSLSDVRRAKAVSTSALTCLSCRALVADLASASSRAIPIQRPEIRATRRSAVRADAVGLVLADHEARWIEARHPLVPVAVLLPVFRGSPIQRRSGPRMGGSRAAAMPKGPDDRPLRIVERRHRYRRSGHLPRPGRRHDGKKSKRR